MSKLTFAAFAIFSVLPGVRPLSAQQSLAEAAAQANAERQKLPADAPSRDEILKLLDLMQVRRNMQTVLDGMKELISESKKK